MTAVRTVPVIDADTTRRKFLIGGLRAALLGDGTLRREAHAVAHWKAFLG